MKTVEYLLGHIDELLMKKPFLRGGESSTPDGGVDSDGTQKLVAFVMPKVQLNTKMILESLSTSMAGFSLAGTGRSIEVESGKPTPFYVDTEYTLPSAS